MKAIRIDEFGGSEQVRVAEIPVPELEPEQALVRIRAAGVNPVDWMVREQIYNPPGQDRVPLTLGQDFAGVIERIGPGTRTRFQVGDPVFGEVFGSFAEYAAVPLADLLPQPPQLDDVVAASIPMPGLTAWQVVIATAQAKSGMRFLVHGAAGAIGWFAVQLARWQGAEVVGTASAESREALASLGIERVFDYRRERYEELVGDVDVVIDPAGGATQARSWPVLKRGGMLINLIGEIDRAAADRAGVQGVAFGMDYNTADIENITRLLVEGVLKPHVTQVLPLAQARQALDLNQQGKSHGKIVLRVS